MQRILVVEDESLLCSVYKNIFEKLFREGKIPTYKIHVAVDYEEAVFHIDQNKQSGTTLDFCLLDYRLAGTKVEYGNGLTLGLKIKELFPACKIVMITSISDSYLLHSLLEELNPNGILIKSDLDLMGLEKDIISIIRGKIVYSKKVARFIRKKSSVSKHLDERDLKMIHLMDQGFSLPEIGRRLGLSTSGIEYRKRRIAQKLGSSSSNIKDLLQYLRNELKLI